MAFPLHLHLLGCWPHLHAVAPAGCSAPQCAGALQAQCSWHSAAARTLGAAQAQCTGGIVQMQCSSAQVEMCKWCADAVRCRGGNVQMVCRCSADAVQMQRWNCADGVQMQCGAQVELCRCSADAVQMQCGAQVELYRCGAAGREQPWAQPELRGLMGWIAAQDVIRCSIVSCASLVVLCERLCMRSAEVVLLGVPAAGA